MDYAVINAENLFHSCWQEVSIFGNCGTKILSMNDLKILIILRSGVIIFFKTLYICIYD